MTTFVLSAFPLPTILAARIESARRRWLSAPAVEAVTVASDAELVTDHLAGDPRAFSELVKRYNRAIYNVTYRFTNDAYEAENLTQETFVRAWNALPRLTLDRPLKAYLIKIAVNLCHDWAEQRQVQTVVLLEEEGETDIPDERGDPLRAVGEKELAERIRAKIELLPPLYRTVIALRYTEEMSYEEMTIALDLPLNTVRTHLHRAKARLRELLEQD